MPSPHIDAEYYQPSFSSPPPSSNRWGPYSTSKEFNVNMASILVILVLATVLAFTLHALIRWLLRLYRRRHQQPLSSALKHSADKNSILDALPTLVFSASTELAGGPECAICLCEFVNGESVRVLPACNHGFHVKCVEGWLVSKTSCPTCRTSCWPPPAEP